MFSAAEEALKVMQIGMIEVLKCHRCHKVLSAFLVPSAEEAVKHFKRYLNT